MIENINTIELKGPMKSSKIPQIFSLISPEINTEIQTKLTQFKTTNDFFNYYTKKNIDSYLNDLNNLNINLSNIYDNYYPSNASYKEKKISIISKIFIFLKIFINIQHILNDQLISIKKYLFDIFHNYEFFTEQNEYKNLLNLIKNTTNIQNNTNSKRRSRKSTRDNSPINDNSNKDISYNSFCHNFDLNSSTQNIIYDSINKQAVGDQTPSFNFENLIIKNTKSFSIKKICKEKKAVKGKEAPNDIDIRKRAQVSLTDLVFVVEKTDQNLTNIKLTNESMKNLFKDKIKKQTHANAIHYSKKNIKQSKKYHSIDYKRLVNRDCKTKVYRYLLENIKKSYSNCYINAEEKSRLKQLIISKPGLIEEIYITFFKSGNNEKSRIIDYLKNYL